MQCETGERTNGEEAIDEPLHARRNGRCLPLLVRQQQTQWLRLSQQKKHTQRERTFWYWNECQPPKTDGRRNGTYETTRGVKGVDECVSVRQQRRSHALHGPTCSPDRIVCLNCDIVPVYQLGSSRRRDEHAQDRIENSDVASYPQLHHSAQQQPVLHRVSPLCVRSFVIPIRHRFEIWKC